jgi:hypothetical protein
MLNQSISPKKVSGSIWKVSGSVLIMSSFKLAKSMNIANPCICADLDAGTQDALLAKGGDSNSFSDGVQNAM